MNNSVSVLSFRYVTKNYKNIVSVSKGLYGFLINYNYNDSKLIKALDNKLDDEISEINFEIIKTIINFVRDRQIINVYLKKYISFYKKRITCSIRHGWPDSFYQIIKLLTINLEDIQHNQNELISLACGYGYLDFMELLIERNIDINKDKILFNLAITNNYLDIAKIFVKKIPNICLENDNLLYTSILFNNIESIIFLVENGANTHIFSDHHIKDTIKNNLFYQFDNMSMDEINLAQISKINSYINSN